MQTVIGVFEDRFDAEAAIDELQEMGFNPKDVSVVVKDGAGENASIDHTSGTKGGSVAEGAVSGAATGGVLGGLAGLLIGIGALTIPGVGAFLVGGPIAIALGLTGAAAATISGATTGALAGGLVGGLIGLGVPEDEAREYAQKVRDGAVLLAVPTNTETGESEVRKVFDDYNADSIRTIREMNSVG
ncbi:MAG: general stress protein [bacterium]|nr:general stress protein [bacterium]